MITLFLMLSSALLIECHSNQKKQPTTEEWAERRHPPSDTSPLPEGCKAIKYLGGYYPIAAAIRGNGRYCVIHDFIQRKAIDWIEGGTVHGSPTDSQGDGSVLTFYKSSLSELDLREHLISGRPFKNVNGIGILGNDQVFLKVHNGKIETPGAFGIGVEMAPNIMINKRMKMLTEDTSVTKKSNWNPETETFNKIPWDYFPPTFYTAENLQIKSGGRAIIMAGSDNVVRNNTIEVDGRTAVYLYGPRSLVEGNTFIVHMDLRDKAPLPAILKLRDADGSIIRNNRFIVKRSGLFRKKEEEPQAGINLLESKDVVIEGNVFEQVALPVRKDAASTTTESGNISKGSP
ncbi:right-handed parallel beta-helix repeat-containing protein [Delftia tsuruhatensis]|nr:MULTISPECIES: right-handed parallel beta-helix repeat-containing protein [Delftia]WEM01582.1 right-handed parallel beta-helix repeat-containing protein [Delftia tsuruhatensis]WQM85328.1 right-handed parallel beta-helix repeat-containing protein [Delftia tsuruhatensis]